MALLQRTIQGARQQMMTGTMVAVGMAVGILICCLLVVRSPNRRAGNGRFADRSGSADGNDAGDSGSHFAWSTGENFVSHHAAAASDPGGGADSGGDNGGGGDGGGGGGGGSD
jgi:hypothetical protein